MIVSRRGFLAGILAAAVAPAIVKSSSLMNIIVPDTKIVVVPKMPSRLSFLAGDYDGDVCGPLSERIGSTGVSDLQALINATRIRMSNVAVDALVSASETINGNYATEKDNNGKLIYDRRRNRYEVLRMPSIENINGSVKISEADRKLFEKIKAFA